MNDQNPRPVSSSGDTGLDAFGTLPAPIPSCCDHPPISRRAVVNHILSSVALTSAAIPAAELGAPGRPAAATIEELAEHFRESAQALDPRINECWIGYDELAKGPRDMRVMSIYFGRKDTPFVVAHSATVAPTIADLFDQWREARQDGTDETEEDVAARLERYAELQSQVLAKRPRTVRELAIQFVVETDDSESAYRDEFYGRLRLLAMGE